MPGPLTVTRFNPTVNGPLHLGHLYMVLVNEHEAHATLGGRFVVRFDDNQPFWERRLGVAAIRAAAERMQEDLEWCGIQVDEWIYQSQIQDDIDRELLLRNGGRLPVAVMEEGQRLIHDVALGANPYPYIPHLTADKVLMDYQEGISHLIRGQDLESEYALYCYFCELWHLPFVYHTYLPRLRSDACYDSVNKTQGGHEIREYRKRYSLGDLMRMMSAWCKIDPGGPWSIANIKNSPMICEL